MLKESSTRFKELMDAVARQLISIEHTRSEALFSLPIFYPSGSSAVIKVQESGDDFFVSDFGMGWTECEMMGATHALYTRHANTIAEGAGVGFDANAFFIVRVPKDRLPGAVSTIANCSVEASIQVAFALAERRHADENDALYRRLKAIFEPRRHSVAKDVAIIGSSTHEWKVGSFVVANDNKTIFESVSKHGTSVASVATKFTDIARLHAAPERVSVVKSRKELGTYVGVLSPVCRIIETQVSDDTFLNVARAA